MPLDRDKTELAVQIEQAISVAVNNGYTNEEIKAVLDEALREIEEEIADEAEEGEGDNAAG